MAMMKISASEIPPWDGRPWPKIGPQSMETPKPMLLPVCQAFLEGWSLAGFW